LLKVKGVLAKTTPDGSTCTVTLTAVTYTKHGVDSTAVKMKHISTGADKGAQKNSWRRR